MEYNFKQIEKKWQDKWKENKVYKVSNTSDKPKYYVLDMFPYPSGAGLHVGHPLGYIASDIYSRYKRLKGFNVLHPMGFDSFGLPAEQYAIETGQHPAETTKKNIATFKSQLDRIGFCYDWDREVQTSNPNYYKWTQKIFLELFNSYYNTQKNKAEPIAELIKTFEANGNSEHPTPNTKQFTAAEWSAFDEARQQSILMEFRLAFSKYGEVNWCEALGTVLANDEVVNGVSERGGHPVEKKKMRQWYLRITAYAERLLQGLETVDFSESMKEMQRNWIGRSEGAEIIFPLSNSPHRGENKNPNKDEAMPGFGYAKYKVDSPMSFENAKANRKNSTESEAILWENLRANKLDYKFRRQHPIENYIADFVCLDVWLIVEIDGVYHLTDEQKEQDKNRDNFLKEIGFTTLRFTNEEVTNNLEQTLQKIKDTADKIKATSVEKRNAVVSSTPLKGVAGVRVYTTRPDTIFGVDFMVVAPELDWVLDAASDEQKQAVEEYITYVKSRSERERQAEVKQVTGCFTGAYAINPFNGREIPIYIAEYVLAGYGTGAIMAVPCGDERDFKFAQHFNIPITNIIGEHFNGTEANPTKDAVLQNSDFLNGLVMRDAMGVAISKIEELGIGKRKINYRMRDAGFSRQRYWGEPFPILWKDNVAYALDEKELPLTLPEVEKYSPGPEGQGPLANITDWINQYSSKIPPLGGGGALESSTMPGYAGSSWYFLRYMDPNNDKEFVSKQASDYWNSVDLYIGGTEHAVGHLLYSRMWTKVLFDLGYISFEEPFKKLLNQGMIQGSSRFVYRIWTAAMNKKTEEILYSIDNIYISHNILKSIQSDDKNEYLAKYLDTIIDKNLLDLSLDETKYSTPYTVSPINVDVNIVDGVELDISAFKKWRVENSNAKFILEDGKYICGVETEKMSKSKYNTVNPDELCDKYGADTFRMYEMFLGPVEQSKPWDTKGIEGVHRFIKKLWRLFYSDTTFKNNEAIAGKPIWTNDTPTADELKVLHKTIKKIDEDTERFSYNTAVSAFMVCVNELADLKCNKKDILEPLLILLAPYAPHIAEHLYNEINEGKRFLWVPAPSPEGEGWGETTYPVFNPAILVESEKEYPVSINGKMRTTLSFSLDAAQADIEATVLENDIVKKWLEGNQPKKIIFVKGKMINVVI